MKLLDLSQEPYGIMEWLAILLTYRDIDIQFPIQQEAKDYIVANFYIDIDDYDVIIGYRADDSFFSFARAFLSNTLSFQNLRDALYLGALGKQIVLKSKKSFEAMEPKGYIKASASEWYAKKQGRDSKARKEFWEMNSKPREKGAIYVMNIMDEEMKKNDERLQ